MGATRAIGRGMQLLEEGRLAEARVRFEADLTAAEDADEYAYGEAALGLDGLWIHEQRAALEQARVAAMQQRALLALPPDCQLAHRLAARHIANEAYRTGHPEPILALVTEARSWQQPLALAESLSLAVQCLLGPPHQQMRHQLIGELVAVSPLTGRALDGLQALLWRVVDHLLTGSPRLGRAHRELRRRLGQTRCDAIAYLADLIDVTLMVRAGRLQEAERRADECLVAGRQLGDQDADGFHLAQMVSIRYLEGRGHELPELVASMVDSAEVAEPAAGFRAVIAAFSADSGEHPAARRALAGLRVGGGLAALAPTSTWLVTLLAVCRAAYEVGDADAAREAYALLHPYAGLPVIVSIGVACFGSAHRGLAMAADAYGDLDLAVTHLEAALSADQALDTRAWRPLALWQLADVLTRRGAEGDLELSRSAAREAAAESAAMAITPGRDPCSTDAPVVRIASIAANWEVSCGEHHVVLPPSVGLGYLALLVARTDQEIPALTLVAGESLTEPVSHEVLDHRTMAQYRARIRALQEAIEDAEFERDDLRAASQRRELDELVAALSAGTASSGRVRAFSDAPERARVSVQKALRRAVQAVSGADEQLAAVIQARLTTGIRCCFHLAAGSRVLNDRPVDAGSAEATPAAACCRTSINQTSSSSVGAAPTSRSARRTTLFSRWT